MNIRNEMDEALDKALEEHLKKLFMAYFEGGAIGRLEDELKKVEAVFTTANKMLDKL